MANQFNPDYRISDTERQQAMDDLGAHFAAGRLDMMAYETRLNQVAQATMRSDISELFDDLPAIHSNPYVAEKFYSESEIARARSEGRRTRAGIFTIATVGTFGAAIAFNAGLLLLIIPTIWAMLYLMKIGPDSWYMPSRAKLERERARDARMEQLEATRQIESANAIRRAELKAIRQQRQDELTANALDFADEAIKRLRGKN